MCKRPRACECDLQVCVIQNCFTLLSVSICFCNSIHTQMPDMNVLLGNKERNEKNVSELSEHNEHNERCGSIWTGEIKWKEFRRIHVEVCKDSLFLNVSFFHKRLWHTRDVAHTVCVRWRAITSVNFSLHVSSKQWGVWPLTLSFWPLTSSFVSLAGNQMPTLKKKRFTFLD